MAMGRLGLLCVCLSVRDAFLKLMHGFGCNFAQGHFVSHFIGDRPRGSTRGAENVLRGEILYQLCTEQLVSTCVNLSF